MLRVASDRRRVHLELTAKGRRISAKLQAEWERRSAERLAGLSDDDVATLVRLQQSLLESP